MSYRTQIEKARDRLGSGRPANPVGHILERWRHLSLNLGTTSFRAHQREAIDAFTAHVAKGNNAGYAVIPTAGGKTRIFMGLVGATHQAIDDGGSMVPNTVVLVPTRTLIRQTLRELAIHQPQLQTGYLAAHPVTDGAGALLKRFVAPVTLMTYQRFIGLAEAGVLGPADVDHLVMDEAHRGLSDFRQETLAPFIDSGRTVISAFTATPSFDEEKALSTFLGGANEVIRVPHQRLRDEGILAPVQNYLLAVRIQGNLPRDRMERLLLKRKAHVGELLDFLGEQFGENGRPILDKLTVFYGADRGHARMFAAEYNRRLAPGGKRMVVLTGEDPPGDIEASLNAIKEGRISGIANARLLTEGWDLPAIGLVLGAPTGSLVDELQRAGRAMRNDPESSEDQTAYVVNTYLEINGRIQGKPRYLAEALGDNSILRMSARGAMDASDVDYTDYLSSEYEDEASDSADQEADGHTVEDATVPNALDDRADIEGELPVAVARASEDVKPKPRKALDGTGADRGAFATTHDLLQVFRFLKRRDGHGERTQEWLNARDIREALRINEQNPDYQSLLAELGRTLDEGGACIGDRAVRFEYRRMAHMTSQCLHRDELPYIAKLLGRPLLTDIIPFNDSHINKQIAKDRLTIRSDRTVLGRAALAAFDQAWSAIQQSYVPDLGHSLVEGEAVAATYVKTNFTTTFVLEEEGFRWLAKRLGRTDRWSIPFRTEEWLGTPEAASLLNTNSTHPEFRSGWAELVRAVDAGEVPVLDGVPLRAAYRRFAKGVTFCVHRDDLPAFDAYLNERVPQRSDKYLGPYGLALALGISGRKLEGLLGGIERHEVADRDLPWRRFKRDGNDTVYVIASRLDEFAAIIGVPVTGFEKVPEDWLPRSVAAKAIHVDHVSEWVSKIFTLISRLEPGKQGVVTVGEVEIVGRVFQTARAPIACIHRSSLSNLRKLRPATGFQVGGPNPRRKGEAEDGPAPGF